MWIDIASIVFVCVTANHLGLIAAVEHTIKRQLPIIRCPKCLTCWSVLLYSIATVPCGSPQGVIAAIPRSLAISFLASYSAIWLELLEGIIDTLYNKVYDTIYTNNDTTSSDPNKGDSAGSVSEL